MKLIPRIFTATALSMVLAVSTQAQVRNDPPGGSGPGGGRGPGIEGSVVTQNARSPEVNDNGTITFRLQAPNARAVKLYTDMRDTAAKLIRIQTVYEPDRAANERYQSIYPIYRRIYDHLRDDFDAAAALF